MAANSNTGSPSALAGLDTAHHLHPFTDHRKLALSGGSRIITRGDGVWLEDADGNRYLDGMAGLWCVNVGYGRVELAEAAYEQMSRLPYYNTFFNTATEPAVQLAARIAGLLPERFRRIFFVNSGSEANDTIVRLVRHYWNLAGKPSRKTIISRHNAYHGSTMAAASLGGMSAMHEQGDLPLPGFVHIGQPYAFTEGAGEDPAAFGLRVARELETKILELGPDNVAAFIGEPVQGAGGVIVPPDSYWPEIGRICREYEILLIADEVICGFGRTGRMFGFETYGIAPDIVPMAKGLTSGYMPLGAVAIADRVADLLVEKGGEFAHGFTWSGHPVACAVAMRNLDIIEDESLVARVGEDTGPYFAAALAGLADHPLVGETRSVGLLGAIELVADRDSRRRYQPADHAGDLCRDHCLANGLIMRAIHDVMLLSPPLVITRDEVDEIAGRARRALDLTHADLTGA